MVSIAGRPLALQPSMFRGADPSAKSYCHSRARVSRSTDLTQAGIQYSCTNTALCRAYPDTRVRIRPGPSKQVTNREGKGPDIARKLVMRDVAGWLPSV